MQKSDGMNYAPEASGVIERVVKPGEFRFAAIGLDHGHIYGMTRGLVEAGATLAFVYDPDPVKVKKFLQTYPQAVFKERDEILRDASIQLVASAIVPCKRAALGLEVMDAGKDFFSDKPGMLTEEEVDAVEKKIKETGRRYFIYFSERIHVEGAVYAERLIKSGALGRIVTVTILAPHRLNPASRPDWFWDPKQNGGIIGDIGSHQLEQFLTYSGAKSARISASHVGNFHNPEHPDFQDFGDVSIVADNGTTGYLRVDWFTPDGLGAWGDGRLFIVGTKATVEIRKYLDVGRSNEGDQVYLVDKDGEHHLSVRGKTGFPFFGAMILDCINRTELAIGQEHTLDAMRLTIRAQEHAEMVTK